MFSSREIQANCDKLAGKLQMIINRFIYSNTLSKLSKITFKISPKIYVWLVNPLSSGIQENIIIFIIIFFDKYGKTKMAKQDTFRFRVLAYFNKINSFPIRETLLKQNKHICKIKTPKNPKSNFKPFSRFTEILGH